MSLTLHFHPLASFCWKALVALYENDTPFTPNIVDLEDERSRAAFLKLWPLGKFPVLEDTARDRVVPESSIIIIEYLATHYPGRAALLPADPDTALRVRLADRFYDFYVHEPMQRVVADRLRPEDRRDAFGVEQARAQIRTSYAIIEHGMADRDWAAGSSFTMADCAAMPSLFYANKVEPFGKEHANVARYHDRLLARPSAVRVIEEAKPYFHMFPYNKG
ncbi:glutathione S-transferase family protein [Mesorhizobium sp. SP-1A]|uniref:glutathione S-transferase family protein n=1 Tax=Mesorhizobium sp. SP-1A TaxID=3077840 RepID=UPI0028F722C0|nr:glutathione S-transferase family protein [Mesorhizobium sp. SP-1A]